MKRAVLSLLLIHYAAAAFAQIGGSATYKFLNLPFSARTASLGGNLISVKDDDINLVAQNPSLLNADMSNRLSLSYINYFTDINYGYAAYARSYEGIGSFSAGIQFVEYGEFRRADETGTVDGTFRAADYSLNLAYSRDLDSMFSVGAQLKTIYSSMESYWSVGNALDLGATYFDPARGFTAAAVIRNLGMQWRGYSESGKEPLPFEVQMGLSKKLKHAPFRFSLIATNLQKWDLTYEDPENPVQLVDPLTGDSIKQNKARIFGDKLLRHAIFGVEFLLTKNFNLRFGFNYERRKELKLVDRPGMVGFSFGFGFRISKIHISYGFAKYHIGSSSNHFTLSANLSEFYSRK